MRLFHLTVRCGSVRFYRTAPHRSVFVSHGSVRFGAVRCGFTEPHHTVAFLYLTVRCGSARFYRTSPHRLLLPFNKTAPDPHRTGPHTASHRRIIRNQKKIRTEPNRWRRLFKMKRFTGKQLATYGAGTVRRKFLPFFYRITPHRTRITKQKTAPHRTVGAS